MDVYSHQLKAIEKMHNGCILCGGVGTGKSRTALLYFFTKVCGGNVEINDEGFWGEPTSPRNLFIITTAKKRDSFEWEQECVPFGISENPDETICGITVTIDSWNNIKKYTSVSGAFFIFAEQRVSGRGAWVKAFLQITKKNQWVLLSATPGDKWEDYCPVFVANGYFKNRSEFIREHVVYASYVTFPKIERYLGEDVLRTYLSSILVRMYYKKKTLPIHRYLECEYNVGLYKQVVKRRYNPYEDRPIENASEYCYILRRVVNSDKSRLEAVKNIVIAERKVIIFYNFDYELEALKELFTTLKVFVLRQIPDGPHTYDLKVAEWNGHKHEPIPQGDYWVYLVQYNSGAEGWNCVETDTTIFFSQNYSYRMQEQAAGRIDRLNTPFDHLFYWHLYSKAPIDVCIARAIREKKDFNQRAFASVAFK